LRPRGAHLPPPAQHAVDLELAGLLVVNAGTVGVAGAPTAPARLLALVPHLPVEFAALSLAGGAYLSAAAVPLRRWFLTRVALAGTGMLTATAYSKPTCNWPPIHDWRGGLVVVTFA
jgi:hypothetical protein